jgi:flagellar basal-body rod modification protein FlgD
MASAISPLTGSPTTTNTTTPSSASAAPSESVFLNLLVSQIQNQDPLNPTDSTQFVSQLAQFSELEQVMGIRSDTDQMAATAAASASASTAAASSTTATNPTGSSSSNSPAPVL